MVLNEIDIFERRHLADFDPREPYVWRLKLPYSLFEELEALVEARPEYMKEHPVAAIVYLAEWYKWRKRGSATDTRKYVPDTEELKQILADAGIDTEKFVAVNPETGRHAWLYSIYALGGLPISQELERNKPSRFLTQICRLYHGEDADIGEESVGDGRSVAFRKAMEEGGSIHTFLKSILEGGMPFSEEDYADNQSIVNRFIKRLVEVNKESLRDKYNLNWIINCPKESRYISRSLEIRLANEPNGSGMHQYLPYARLMGWGFSNPAELTFVRLGVRFLSGENEIAIIPKVVVYTNTGIAEKGFLCWNVEDSIRVKDIPVSDFSEVELIATGSNGQTVTIQRFQWKLPMQLFRTRMRNEWTSRTQSQNDSAVVWRSPWQPTEALEEGLSEQRLMHNRREENLDLPYNFTYVPESLTLASGEDTITFHDRKGQLRLTSSLHTHILRYEEGDKVRLLEMDEDGDETEELLPVIFTRSDLKATLYSSELNESETLELDRIEWKNGARYEEWSEQSTPPTGKVKLRCEVKRRQLIREFLYIGGEIVRKLSLQEIIYPEGTVKDSFDLNDPTPLPPTYRLELPLDSGRALMEVWRPFRLQEANAEERCWRRETGERIAIPLLEAERIWVSVFDEKGYRRYGCAPLRGVYSGLDSNRRWSLIEHSTPIAAESIDPLAPECLDAVMGYPGDQAPKDTEWLSWNYSPEEEPTSSEFKTEMPTLTLLFQNRKGDENPLDVYSAVRGTRNAFKMKRIMNARTRLRCFELAIECNAYFAAFLPLNEMTEEQFKDEIYEPLLQRHAGNLPENLKKNLRSAAYELGYVAQDVRRRTSRASLPVE